MKSVSRATFDRHTKAILERQGLLKDPQRAHNPAGVEPVLQVPDIDDTVSLQVDQTITCCLLT